MDTTPPGGDASPLALVERGLWALKNGDVETALRQCLAARDLAPALPEHLYLMGLISIKVDRQADAIDCLLEGHRLAPSVREFSAALAELFARHGRLVDSIFHAKLTHSQTPNPLLSEFQPVDFVDPDKALSRAGISRTFHTAFAAFLAGDLRRAKAQCEETLRLHPDSASTQALYGRVLLGLGLFGEARLALGAALDGGETDPILGALMSEALAGDGDLDAAVAVGREAVRLAPGDADVLARLIAAWDRLPDRLHAARDPLIAAWVPLAAGAVTPSPLAPAAPRGRPKVALLLDEEAATRLLDPVAALLDHSGGGIEYQVYQVFMHSPAAVSRLGTRAALWRELVEVDEETAAAIIRGAGADVLIDVGGVAPGRRAAILAARAAPVQLSWLGEGVALPWIDRVVTDPLSRRALPADLGLVELPAGPFSLPRGAVQTSQALATEAPARRNGFVTFGATLDLPRLLPSVETWATILAQDPGHHLILGAAGEISQSVLARVEAAFARYGLTERILIDLPDPSPTSGESFWTKADVILSPLDAPDPLEAAQALLMGTPVVGLAGPRLAHARTAGVLSMAGQDHWIAADRAGYVQIAATMARSPAAVADLREALRGTIDQMPLCDAATFVATFEAALAALARGG